MNRQYSNVVSALQQPDNGMFHERYEYDSLLALDQIMRNSFSHYVGQLKTISFNDLLQHLCRQAEGRSRNYQYSLEEALEHHYRNLNPSSMTQLEKEFRMRLVSTPFLKVGPERFIHDSLVKWLTQHTINYENFYSPNSSDCAILIENSQINRIESILNLNYGSALSQNYDGILLNIDSKSINGIANLGDALVDSYVGKFEAKWNQISYPPPLLRSTLSNHSTVIRNRYAVLNPDYTLNGRRYYTVTLFFSDLAYIPSSVDLFAINTTQINGSIFDHVGMIACIPNGMLQNGYYDQFFDAGKGGYDATLSPQVPKDVRIKIKSRTLNLEFQHLTRQGTPKRYFHYSNAGRGQINASTLDIGACGFSSCSMQVL